MLNKHLFDQIRLKITNKSSFNSWYYKDFISNISFGSSFSINIYFMY